MSERPDECIHELPIGTCSLCKPKPKKESPTVSPGAGKFARPGPPRPTSTDRIFTEAQYDGWCLWGEHPIEAGTRITRSPDDQGWNCEEHA